MKVEVVKFTDENRYNCHYHRCNRPILCSPRICGGCKSVAYCSKTCAKKDWNGEFGLHRNICMKGLIGMYSRKDLGRYHQLYFSSV